MKNLEIRAHLMAIRLLADGELSAINDDCLNEAKDIATYYRKVVGMGIIGRLKHMPEVRRRTEAFYESYPKPAAAHPKR